MAVCIAPASSDAELAAFASLTSGYIAALGLDLSFQGVQAELRTLPGCYASPDGCILLARDLDGGASKEAKYLGCVALRPLDLGVNKGRACEVKRLFVLPSQRGDGLGRALMEQIMQIASNKGFKFMVLDTVKSLNEANHLYKKLGFKERDPYYKNPLPDVIYWELNLDNDSGDDLEDITQSIDWD